MTGADSKLLRCGNSTKNNGATGGRVLYTWVDHRFRVSHHRMEKAIWLLYKIIVIDGLEAHVIPGIISTRLGGGGDV